MQNDSQTGSATVASLPSVSAFLALVRHALKVDERRAAQLTTELSVAFAVPPLTGKEFEMPRPPRDISARTLARSDRDILHVQDVGKNTRAKPISSHTTDPDWPPVPDLFDVITYFRARGDSFTLIASIGFWVGEAPKKALTARGLKLWYEGELERRAAAKASIR